MAMGFADTAIIHTAERQIGVNKLKHTVIDANTTRRRFFQYFFTELPVVGKDIECKWFRLRIDQRYRGGLCVQTDNRQYRPEDLLLHHKHVIGYIGQYRWWKELCCFIEFAS